MHHRDDRGDGYKYKPTCVVTNGIAVASALDRERPRAHRHVHLLSGLAGDAASYPRMFCDAVIDALGVEVKWRKEQGIKIAGVRHMQLLGVNIEQDSLHEDFGQAEFIDDIPSIMLYAPAAQKSSQEELGMF